LITTEENRACKSKIDIKNKVIRKEAERSTGMTVEDKEPFIHFSPRSNGEEYCALLGFRVTGMLPLQKEKQVLASNLLDALYRSGVTALELRMTKGVESEAITTSLLCHLQYVPRFEARIFPGFCRLALLQVNSSFWGWGFDIEPYIDEASLLRVLMPFGVEAPAQVSCEQRVIKVQDNDLYGCHKVYTQCPWAWSENIPQVLAEILSQQSGQYSVSIYLRLIQLDEEKQVPVEHVTSLKASMRRREENQQKVGEADVYQMFVRKSGQIYLIRISFAAASERELGQLRQALARQLPIGNVTEPEVQLSEDDVQKRFTWQDFIGSEWVRWEDRCGDEHESS
jgi:hypothetical protein